MTQQAQPTDRKDTVMTPTAQHALNPLSESDPRYLEVFMAGMRAARMAIVKRGWTTDAPMTTAEAVAVIDRERAESARILAAQIEDEPASTRTASADRLLPDGTETRTEWATRLKAHGQYAEELCESYSVGGFTEEERARTRAAHWCRRFGDELVDVMRREVHTTPWTPA